jgi:hypothetical protein
MACIRIAILGTRCCTKIALIQLYDDQVSVLSNGYSMRLTTSIVLPDVVIEWKDTFGPKRISSMGHCKILRLTYIASRPLVTLT